MGLAEAARYSVAVAFDDYSPARDLLDAFALELRGIESDIGLGNIFDGPAATLTWAGTSWALEVDGTPVAMPDSKALGHAINAVGPWGSVWIGEGPPVSGGTMGAGSWNSVATQHPGPVRVVGGQILGLGSTGPGAPALWVQDAVVLCPTGASSTVQVHPGTAARPMVFQRVTFAAQDPEHTGWPNQPGGWPLRWHVSTHSSGPMGFSECVFLDHVEEHHQYHRNLLGGLYLWDCDMAETRRTAVQVVNRMTEGPAGFGWIGVENCRIRIGQKVGKAGGGGALTIAGHHGEIGIIDVDFTTGPSARPFDSHNALVVIWGEPTSANSSAWKLPDGYWTHEVAVAGIRVLSTEEFPFIPDRRPFVYSATRIVSMERPFGGVVDTRFAGGNAFRLSINDQGANVPGSGESLEIGLWRWSAQGGSAHWQVHGHPATWAAGLTGLPATGEYGPLAH